MRFRNILSVLLVALAVSLPLRAQSADSFAVVRAQLDSITTAAGVVARNGAAIRALLPAPPVPTVTSGLTSVALLSDDFTKYADTKAFLANVSAGLGGTGGSASLYNDGLNGSLLELDPNTKYNGHATLKYNQPGGVATTPQVWVGLRTQLTKMWLRVKVRYSPGFTTKGTTVGAANAYKLLGWGWAGTEGRGTLEFTNTSQYSFNWYVKTSSGTQTGTVTEKNGPNVVAEWTDGAWYDYIVFVEQTSSTTVRERWWVAKDGTAPVLQADIVGKMTVGTAPPADRVGLGMNFNSSRYSGASQALWIGQWEVIDGSKYVNPFNLSL